MKADGEERKGSGFPARFDQTGPIVNWKPIDTELSVRLLPILLTDFGSGIDFGVLAERPHHGNLFEFPDERMKRNLLIAVLILISIAALLAAGNLTGLLRSSERTLEITHWVAILSLVVYAAFRRTLGTWILVAMIVGAALGHDFPNFAVSLRILAQIFLRLIKTIIAPLIFASLVSGIAGHADLKAVVHKVLASK